MTDADSTAKPMSLLALEEAIRAAGSQTALARQIGKKQGHVATWLNRGKCDAKCVLDIEAATGVSRHRLRDDVFGPAPTSGVAAEAVQ